MYITSGTNESAPVNHVSCKALQYTNIAIGLRTDKDVKALEGG